MSDFNLAENIRNRILSVVSQVLEYEWSEKFKIEELNRIESKIKESKGFKFIDLSTMNISELESLGFNAWDDDKKLMLLPLWITKYASPKTELTSISGNKSNDINSVDKDVRFGCIAWGVTDFKLD